MSNTMIRSFLCKARHLAPSLSARALVQLVLPFSAALAIVLNVGPSFQYYIYALVGNSSPSLYDSAYPDGIAKFPPLNVWVSNFDPGLTLIAFIAALVGFSAKSISYISSRIAATTLIGMFLMDAAVMLVKKTLSAEAVIQNLIADLLGSAFLYAFVSIAISIFRNRERASALPSSGARFPPPL
jgi:hypothetical protein